MLIFKESITCFLSAYKIAPWHLKAESADEIKWGSTFVTTLENYAGNFQV